MSQVVTFIRVAVATRDGRAIDMHFGHAEGFWIYTLTRESVTFVESRLVEHYCQGGYGDEDKRDVIVRTLADCKAVFAARIGPGPRPALQAAGIEPVDAFPFGEVERSLLEWAAGKIA